MEGGEKEDKLNHLSRRHRARTNWMPIILITMLAITITLIIPVVHETDVHVLIGSAGNIETVWVDTPYKPIISSLFPQSYPLGAYSIYITITGPANATLVKIHVPIGEIVILWQTGVPSTGNYTIKVQLFGGVPNNTYSLNVSF